MELKLNIKNWTLRQYSDFGKATREGDFEKIISLLSVAVESWSYPGDPHNVDYWMDNLKLSDWQLIVNKVSQVIQTEFAAKN